jgi:enoyl-[acyl-carrier protein] reductase I
MGMSLRALQQYEKGLDCDCDCDKEETSDDHPFD